MLLSFLFFSSFFPSNNNTFSTGINVKYFKIPGFLTRITAYDTTIISIKTSNIINDIYNIFLFSCTTFVSSSCIFSKTSFLAKIGLPSRSILSIFVLYSNSLESIPIFLASSLSIATSLSSSKRFDNTVSSLITLSLFKSVLYLSILFLSLLCSLLEDTFFPYSILLLFMLKKSSNAFFCLSETSNFLA